jgi:hypothetical protein
LLSLVIGHSRRRALSFRNLRARAPAPPGAAARMDGDGDEPR